MIKNGLMRQVEKERDEEEKQKKLHEKYKKEAIPEQAVIIEKNNMGKFMVKTVGSCLRIMAQITIFILAVCGLIALIYPQSREVLWQIGIDTINQIQNLMKK